MSFFAFNRKIELWDWTRQQVETIQGDNVRVKIWTHLQLDQNKYLKRYFRYEDSRTGLFCLAQSGSPILHRVSWPAWHSQVVCRGRQTEQSVVAVAEWALSRSYGSEGPGARTLVLGDAVLFPADKNYTLLFQLM